WSSALFRVPVAVDEVRELGDERYAAGVFDSPLDLHPIEAPVALRKAALEPPSRRLPLRLRRLEDRGEVARLALGEGLVHGCREGVVRLEPAGALLHPLVERVLVDARTRRRRLDVGAHPQVEQDLVLHLGRQLGLGLARHGQRARVARKAWRGWARQS